MVSFKILLIAYKNRSGSTLLSNWLSRDERILVFPEGGDMPAHLLREPLSSIDEKRFNLIKEKLRSDSKLSHWNVDFLYDNLSFSDQLTSWQLLQNILELYRDHTKKQATVFVLKHPRFAGLADQLPGFSFYRDIIFTIFLMRDGRAIYNSSKRSLQSNLPVPMEYNPVQSAKYWINFTKAASDCVNRNQNESQACLVRYEDLLTGKEDVLKKIYSFISLNYTDDKLGKADLSRRISGKQKHLHGNIDADAVTGRINSWSHELTPWEIYLFEQKAKHNLLLYGYPLSSRTLNTYQAALAQIKLFTQVTFNHLRLLYYKMKLRWGQ